MQIGRAGRLPDLGFGQLTKPKRSIDERIEELDGTLEAPDQESHEEPPPGPTPKRELITRPRGGRRAQAYQDALIRGELWLLERHLKNDCVGCCGDVECC